MTLFEKIIQRCITEELISFDDWQEALRSVRVEGIEERKTANARTMELLRSNELLGESVWSMLIYLFVMRANGRAANLTNCCRVMGTSRRSCLVRVEMLVERKILMFQGNRIDSENPNLALSVEGSWMVEEAIHTCVNTKSEKRFAEASVLQGDNSINKRIAKEMNISLKAVETHRANMRATSD